MSNYTLERNKIATQFHEARFTDDFDALSLAIFHFQYAYNPVYRRFCQLIGVKGPEIQSTDSIPFLPISFFKNKTIKTGDWKTAFVFKSSGTTGQIRSQHAVRSLDHYLENTVQGFTSTFAHPAKYCFLAVLPGYIERPDSSLIFMVNEFIRISKYDSSGFYLGKEEQLLKILGHNKQHNVPTVLFGVSFALLDLCKYRIDFDDLVVIETGGMKNSKIDLTKEEIISRFKEAWKVREVASEYGMTELLSQSYSHNGKWYSPAKTKRVVIGSLRDPFEMEENFKTGIIKVMDLANYDTCSFIETEDLGVRNPTGEFQVLGRMDTAELRGCNLLLDEALENPIR